MAATAHFDRAASFYDETRGFPPGDELAIAALMNRAAALKPSDRLLEVGIGSGRIAVPLLSYVGAIYGVDLSTPMLQRLRGKHFGQRIYGARADARRLPFHDAAFDVALAVHLFNLIPDWEAAVDEIGRVLRPDGILLNPWHRDFHKESWWNAWLGALPGDRRRDPGLPLGDQHDTLLSLGWRPVEGDYVHIYSRHITPRVFLEQLAGRVWTSTWALSEAQLNASINAVREAMAREYADMDQEFELATRFVIYAYRPPK